MVDSVIVFGVALRALHYPAPVEQQITARFSADMPQSQLTLLYQKLRRPFRCAGAPQMHSHR